MDKKFNEYVLSNYANKISKVDFAHMNLDSIEKAITCYSIPHNALGCTRYSDTLYNKISDILKASRFINGVVEYINKFKLTPLEQCMFAYDLIREKPYKYGDNTEKLDAYIKENPDKQDEDVDEFLRRLRTIKEYGADCRNLIEIYNSDATVCVGFSRLYQAVLNGLGITTEEINYRGEKAGHESTIVYLNDEEYNQHLVMEVDPTWGRFYNDDVYDYEKTQLCYKYFGLPLKKAIQSKKSTDPEKSMEPDFGNAYINLLNKLNTLKGLIDLKAPYFIATNSAMKICQEIIHIHKKTGLDVLVDFKTAAEDIIDNKRELPLETIWEIFSQEVERIHDYELDPEVFEKALLKVKILENKIDSAKYPLYARRYFAALSTRFPVNPERYLLGMIINPVDDELRHTTKKSLLKDNVKYISKRNPFMPKK